LKPGDVLIESAASRLRRIRGELAASVRVELTDSPQIAIGAAGMVLLHPPVVLVVEDELLTLFYAVELVTDAGFEAVSAKNADEAINILESRHDIQVIFTDIDMPGSMDGLKLAHAVRDRWPPIDIIVTSGFNFGSARRLPERGVFLPKPYSATQIAGVLRNFAA
jgi:CheY-like chemotaxis protein